MNENVGPLHELSPIECQLRLKSRTVGRIVARVKELVDIFPVNYVVDGTDIVIRTAPGTKLAEIVIGGDVLFEVDEFDDQEAWSVVVRGTARLLESDDEIAEAEALPLKPLLGTDKRYFVRITPSQVTGRGFEVGEEPPRDGPQDY